jgi:hypothetical protein
MQLARYILQLFMGIALPLALQLWHRRWLTDEARARAWNTASWAAALYAFGPLSMVGWGWVTTCRWWGVVVGTLCAVALAYAIFGIDLLFARALGLS